MCTDGRRCSSCPARRLNAGSREIGAALPALGTVVSCTANDAALLSHTGEYAVPAHPGEALLCGQEQISVRLGAGVTGYLTPRALTLTEAFGTHRAYLTPMSDPLVVKGLSLAPRGPQVAHTAEDWLGVDWNDTDQIDHLDSLSPERYRVLPFTGARKIDPRVLPHLLVYLVEQNVEYTVAVPGGGCVQLHRGRAAMADTSGPAVAVIFGAARYALDPVQVGECWVTSLHGAAGPTAAIEIYDHSRRCVTMLTLTGSVCGHTYDDWQAIASSLPGI
jgi:putative hemin transport protein